MSFFGQQHDPTRREDLDPRVNAWRDNKPNIASSPGYVQTAQNAQKSASGSSIPGGKIVTPIHVKARDNLPSNVRGLHGTNKSGPSSVDTAYHSVTNQSAWSGTPPASVRGQPANVPAFAGSASRMSGPAFMSDVRGGSASNATGQASSYKAPPAGRSNVPKASMPSTGATGQPSSKPHESIPPHLRPSPSASLASTSKPTKDDSKSSRKMNAGILPKSAKNDSNFPCTYKDCTRGFAKEKDLKDHKDEEHEWCRLCKMDFVDFDDLLEHKIYSERHICCAICGEDFRSEGGRDKHQRQMHATEQNIKCPGCGYIFEKGASLIAHIYANQCNNRGGGLSNGVNELKIRETRAAAALHMNQLLNRPSETGALIAAMQPSETGDFQSVDGSVGGVALTPSFLDADIPNSENIEVASTTAGTLNVGDDGQNTVKDRGSVGPNMADTADWPTVEDSKAKGKKNQGSVIQGLGALTVRDFNGSGPKSPGLSEALIPGIKPIPAIGEWMAPTMPDFRRNIVPSQSGSQHIIRTDWDAMKFERHGLDGHFHCPFTGCKANYLELNDLLYHLTSGYHQGTDHRCLKCLKVFKSAQALIAHMESNSERCRIKDTYGFGNVLHVVSGGFLGVKGRHKDGTIKIEAPDVPDEERYKLNTENDFDDEEEPQMLEGRKPRMLMPHERKQPTADEMLS